MVKVAIVGATGYAGAELVRILSGHPLVNLTLLTSRRYAGRKFHDIYPSMTGFVDLTLKEYAAQDMCDSAEVVFMALPHKLPMKLVPELIDKGKKVIDLSADFRFENIETYEQHYQPHTAPATVGKAVYGLSEIFADKIRKSVLVGNPGCYPTSVLLPVIPVIAGNLVKVDSIIADSKSGVSGAGRAASLTSHYCQVNESFKAYKITSHRHNPEMEEVLAKTTGHTCTVTFVPHLVPMSRGMLSTIYCELSTGVGDAAIRTCLENTYADHPFVRICPDGMVPDTLNVKGTNFCDIGFSVDKRANRLVLIAAIDNLVKGAAGQAVQNMNLMCGFDVTAGLLTTPYPL
ncbi:MAG: N-acetyl-gamma-glutamyl-phosphate reductase [Desulfobacteraceae bacterium]|nr:N-acetyl-gamma-glutamyl-phosphate reductase [Desulfobacteraceae bacterium]